jgi:hypothetical protein
VRATEDARKTAQKEKAEEARLGDEACPPPVTPPAGTGDLSLGFSCHRVIPDRSLQCINGLSVCARTLRDECRRKPALVRT